MPSAHTYFHLLRNNRCADLNASIGVWSERDGRQQARSACTIGTQPVIPAV